MKATCEVKTGKELIEEERRRLLKLKESDPDWWSSKRKSDWARARFGKTLTEKDGTRTMNGSPASEGECDLCEARFINDTKLLILGLAYMEVYEMPYLRICVHCIREMCEAVR